MVHLCFSEHVSLDELWSLTMIIIVWRVHALLVSACVVKSEIGQAGQPADGSCQRVYGAVRKRLRSGVLHVCSEALEVPQRCHNLSQDLRPDIRHQYQSGEVGKAAHSVDERELTSFKIAERVQA